MDPKVVTAIVIIVAVLVVVAIIVAVRAARRKAAIRQRFGVEYDRAVTTHGSERKALDALEERQRRVEKFKMIDLDPAQRQQFVDRWRLVQSRFVDDPSGAVLEADDAVTSLMQTRGYPMADFEQRAADLSVDYPHVVENYRSARLIAVRHRQGQATTEDLRQAMIHYRTLFDELLRENANSLHRVA